MNEYWTDSAERALSAIGRADLVPDLVPVVARALEDTYGADPSALDYHLDGLDTDVHYFGPRPVIWHDGSPGIGHTGARSVTYVLPVRDPFTGHLTDLATVAQRRAAMALDRPSDGDVPTVTPSPDPFTGRQHESTAKRNNRGTTTVTVRRYGRATVQGRTDRTVDGQPVDGDVTRALADVRALVTGAVALDVLQATERVYGDRLPIVTLADGRTTTLLGTDVGSLEDMTDNGLTGIGALANHRADITGHAPNGARTVHALRDHVEPVNGSGTDYVPGARDSWQTVSWHADADRRTGPRMSWPTRTTVKLPTRLRTSERSTFGPDRYLVDLDGVTDTPATERFTVLRITSATDRPDRLHYGHVTGPRGQLSARATRATVKPRTIRTVGTFGPDQTPTTLDGWTELVAALDPGERFTGTTTDGRDWTVNRGKTGTTYSGTTSDGYGRTVKFTGRRTVRRTAIALAKNNRPNRP